LKWVTPAGGGKVLQVVQGTTSTSTTIASSSYADTTLTATITPTLATSKVLVIVNQSFQTFRQSVQNGHQLRIMRGATSILDSGVNGAGQIYSNNATEVALYGVTTYNYLDSPATTSATTYKTQGASTFTSNNGSIRYQEGGTSTSLITLIEIGV
jgi:hypothetical protein